MSTRYEDVLKDNQDLQIFIGNLAKFDRAFCEAMVAGVDYTIALEIHGNAGRLIHCRVKNDAFERGPSVDGNKEKRSRGVES